MILKFEKYTVQGNDFIIIDADNKDNTSLSGKDSNLISKLCARKMNIGADGVILVYQRTDTIKFEFYNSDGYPSGMCGNGARAAMDFLDRHDKNGNEYKFSAWDLPLKGKIEDDGMIGVELKIVEPDITEWKFISDKHKRMGYLCNTGVPHCTIFDQQMFDTCTIEMAGAIRNHPDRSPDGTNVNIANIFNENTVAIKSFERGVEDFTFACGTGAAAVAHTGVEIKRLKYPVTVRSKGGEVILEKSERNGYVWLLGTVKKVYSGIVELQK